MRQAIDIAADVRAGRTTAVAVVDACLAALGQDDLGAVTRLLDDRARAEARGGRCASSRRGAIRGRSPACPMA